ncbi:MAG: type III-A CRISPR-associated RAMP protein Csm5 [Anaerolineae bacterium]|jgi:CRISPR-associated protein Csm5|nr:type III-A CRISPR-associated RAMP protein Csm5 [Anaerolineae bacterium]
MAKLHKTFRLTITTLTPLHIGTGNHLLRDFDYVTRDGKTWVVNEEALADLLIDYEDDLAKMAAGRPVSELLRPSDYQADSPLFRYVLPGEPRSEKPGSVLQEQIKDPWDRPYIPGSSLKGALRTALFYAGYEQRKLQFKVSDLGNSAKFAAQTLERNVFANNVSPGKAPNHDLLRALQISDSVPDDQKRLQIVNITVSKNGQSSGSPIELEAIPPSITFEMTLTLDGYLLNDQTRRNVGYEDDQLKWMRRISQVINYWTQQRLATEMALKRYFNWSEGFQRVIQYYEQDQLQKDEFILQLGWGGGWDSKTLGKHLTDNQPEFARLVNDSRFKMLRKGKFAEGDMYPKTRRAVVTPKMRPVSLLGWIWVRMEAMT